MRQFQCDYIAGCHPDLLSALVRTNAEEVPGYGLDPFCNRARDLIRQAAGTPGAGIYFFTGGTLTNRTLISAALRPGQTALAASTGHIAAHETGAIEATGFKVTELPSVDGKIRAEDLLAACTAYEASCEQFLLAKPSLLYLSYPTETGSLYSGEELRAISRICREHGLLLYIDGARLAYGLAASDDLTLADIASLCDALMIGGTKCGALDAEALLITNEKLKEGFLSQQHLRGALISKGRLAGVQFAELFRDGTGAFYRSLGVRAVQDAQRLRAAFIEAGITPDGSSPTNQQFVRISARKLEFLDRNFRCEPCGLASDGRQLVRYCTAWSTKPEAVEELLAAIAQTKDLP